MKKFVAQLHHFCKGEPNDWWAIYLNYRNKKDENCYDLLIDYKEDSEGNQFTTEESKKAAQKYAKHLNKICP